MKKNKYENYTEYEMTELTGILKAMCLEAMALIGEPHKNIMDVIEKYEPIIKQWAKGLITKDEDPTNIPDEMTKQVICARNRLKKEIRKKIEED